MEMYRVLMMMAMISGAISGAKTPQSDVTNQQYRQIELSEQTTNLTNNNRTPVNSGPRQHKSSQPTHYFIPTYPTYNRDNGYADETGYDGYMVPLAQPAAVPVRKAETPSWPSQLFTTLLPYSSTALDYGARAGSYLWNLSLLLLVGGFFVSSLCTFTPFCTITFLGFGINRDTIRAQVAELARTIITPDSIDTATILVKRAIDRYIEIQRKQFEEDQKAKKARTAEKRLRR